MSEESTKKKDRQDHCTAVILAGGSGSRMKSDVAKQFMLLKGKPLLWYSLRAVQQSEIIDDCILVAGAGNASPCENRETEEYVRHEIVEKYGFTKVFAIVEGGSERCWSVENAMEVLRRESRTGENGREYVFIHDSARPFLTEEIICRTYEAVREHRACVAAMPSKDTVKLATPDGFAAATPDRKTVWNIQTPQVFDRTLIAEAYARLKYQYSVSDQSGGADEHTQAPVTDDASVVERFTDVKVKLVEGSYQNIKITTPEDIKVAEAFLE